MSQIFSAWNSLTASWLGAWVGAPGLLGKTHGRFRCAPCSGWELSVCWDWPYRQAPWFTQDLAAAHQKIQDSATCSGPGSLTEFSRGQPHPLKALHCEFTQAMCPTAGPFLPVQGPRAGLTSRAAGLLCSQRLKIAK